jgi:Ni/Co efflux regulator RcnB
VRIARDDRDSPRNHWRGDWRSDHRYDWRRHRDRNRSIFRIGVYFDPFGWNYRRYNVGWRLWPDYYSSSYWIHDPWMYRLPAAYPGTRWIRYHDDALLVDSWSGEVIDVIYSFFW